MTRAEPDFSAFLSELRLVPGAESARNGQQVWVTLQRDDTEGGWIWLPDTARTTPEELEAEARDIQAEFFSEQNKAGIAYRDGLLPERAAITRVRLREVRWEHHVDVLDDGGLGRVYARVHLRIEVTDNVFPWLAVLLVVGVVGAAAGVVALAYVVHETRMLVEAPVGQAIAGGITASALLLSTAAAAGAYLLLRRRP